MSDQVDSSSEILQIEKLLKTLFNHWGLTSSESLEILGHEAPLMCQEQGSETALLLTDSDSVERARLLLSIHARLRILFPRNIDLAHSWMKAENRAFQGQTPTEVACSEGVSGLMKIKRYLENAANC